MTCTNFEVRDSGEKGNPNRFTFVFNCAEKAVEGHDLCPTHREHYRKIFESLAAHFGVQAKLKRTYQA